MGVEEERSVGFTEDPRRRDAARELVEGARDPLAFRVSCAFMRSISSSSSRWRSSSRDWSSIACWSFWRRSRVV